MRLGYLFTLLGALFALSQGFMSQKSWGKERPPSPLTGLSVSYGSPRALACYQKQVSLNETPGVLKEHNMSVIGSSSQSLEQAMATVSQQFKKLGRADLIKDIKVEAFPGPKGRDGKCTNYTAGTNHIQMVINCGGRNVTAGTIAPNLLHEFMHSVGQQGYYQSYDKSVPTACAITGYCIHNDNPNGKRREEFAEVGAMFVHSPQLLQQKCPEAYDFFRKNVFKADPSTSLCEGVAAVNSPEQWNQLEHDARGSSPEGGGAFDEGGDGGSIGGLGAALSGIFQNMNPNPENQEETSPNRRCVMIPKGQTEAVEVPCPPMNNESSGGVR